MGLREKIQKGTFYPPAARFFVRRKIKKACRSGPVPWPLIANIETVNSCNAGCLFCYHSKMKRESMVMDGGLYQEIIDQCAGLGINQVMLNAYGEPLMDEYLPQRISYAKKKGIGRVGFFTNASLLNTEKAKELIASGVDEICVSLDAATQGTYQDQRRGLDYDRVIANLRGLLKLRAGRPKVHLFFAAFAQNKKEIGLFKRAWQGKVDSVNIGSGYSTDVRGMERKNFPPCPYLWKRIAILSNGEVALCCQDYDASSTIGNLRSSGIREIWQGKTMETYRKAHLAGESGSISACGRCELNLWMRWVVPFRF